MAGWDDTEVARRWLLICPVRKNSAGDPAGTGSGSVCGAWSSPGDPCHTESIFPLSAPYAPRVRELLPSSESQRFEKNGRRQIDDPLAGQRIYESVRFRSPRGDVIAFSCIFRQRDHENRVISCPWRCFRPSRAAIFSLTDSANRNHFSVRRVPCAEDEVGSHSVFVTKNMGTLCWIEIVLQFCSNCPNHRF